MQAKWLHLTISLVHNYGHATKAGKSDALLQDLLLDNPAADFGATQSLHTYSTTGILVDLQHAVHLSTTSCQATGKILKWVGVLYPACQISRWDQLERRVRSLALPVQRKEKESTIALDEYLNTIWKPRKTSPQNESTFEMIINY